ncbi:MAG: glycoside hydrolase family 3 C-terminal domain-containing protein [Oscillospiraceae bacterium]|nr:glycoside hydrolase family 3 C-terminal domain-containing protein [Oscillospiraceae bacterium]
MKTYTKASASDTVSERERRNLRIAYRAACEGMVLLKNDGALPLRGKRLALYGAGAARTVKGGTGSGEVNERHSVSILEGLEDRGFEVTTGRWLRDYEEDYERSRAAFEKERRQFYKKIGKKSIIDLALSSFQLPCGRAVTEEDVRESAADSCVYVLSRQAGEGGDRRAEPGDYALTQTELQSIRLCAASYEHFILAVNSGSPLDMGSLRELGGIDALVYLCQPGAEGGHAFADLLSGTVTPSGKLTDTWAEAYADLPFAMEYSYLNGELREEFYREGIYVGYRYFDSFGKQPLYPFGYGLSYTDFTIGPASVNVEGTQVTVTAEVRNAGKTYAGKETLQLYVSAPNGALHKEYQRLAAYGKTGLLAPGEAESLTLRFDARSLASYDEARASFVLEPGAYILRLGNSSRDTRAAAVLSLEREVIVSQHAHVCPLNRPMTELKAAPYPFEDTAELPHIPLRAESFETLQCRYDTPEVCTEPRVRAFLGKLSLRERAEAVVGAGMFGRNRFDLPGSVGNTTSALWDKGLVNVALCDGPAGLRIQSRSVQGRKGEIKPLQLSLSVLEMLPEFIKKPMLGDPEKGTPLYQFCTAFPVATMLAQTWNEELLYEVGKAIFGEMKEYGCTFWLAPAVNIHRNPLCGRNFEYFSEDPLLTGRMAAAITRGVQQEEGYYATVKHLACNNQEENRNGVSSNVGERALREIYLRGFAIAVREGGAKAIMTSYNRLNGVYTANSHDLCTKLLRCEWGFDGVVMTDWFSTGRGRADAALAMQAGNDLIMPGGAGAKAEIRRAVRRGRIPETDLARCCANVLRAILKSETQREYGG